MRLKDLEEWPSLQLGTGLKGELRQVKGVK
jgi:hypothetical protein